MAYDERPSAGSEPTPPGPPPRPPVSDGLAPWGPPPRPPRGGSLSRLLLLILLLLLAAVVAVVAVDLARLATSTTASAVNPAASRRPLAVRQDGDPARPLSVTAIERRVAPGLVDINVTFDSAGRGAATGMVLTPGGVVLTNNHVIAGATKISATDIGNGRTYAASVVGYARSRDVAVLQLNGASGLRTVPLGDSSSVHGGDRVVALGNAGGAGGRPSVARGTVTALDQTITASDVGGGNTQRLSKLIQTDAPIRPGDSGGPLVDSAGRVIAMDAAASAAFTAHPAVTEGFAIPIDHALAIARQIERGVPSATVHVGPTGFLGVQVVPAGQFGAAFGSTPGSQPRGALIGGVLAGYPAEAAGMAEGDIVTSLDGSPVTSANDLTGKLSTHRPGDLVRLAWVDRQGQTHRAAIRLAGGPPQ